MSSVAVADRGAVMGNDESEAKENPGEFKIEFDAQAGDAIEKGFGALKEVFAGFAEMAQQLAGSEQVKNYQAAEWLGRVASSLEDVCAALRDGQGIPVGKSGEITCFVEQLESEVSGTRVASQLDSLQQRLKKCSQIISKHTGKTSKPSEQEAQKIEESCGYFRAASASINASAADTESPSEG